MRSRSALISCLVGAWLLAQSAPAAAGFKDLIKKIFKVAVDGQVTIKLPGAYPVGPTPILLKGGSLTVAKSSVTASIGVTIAGIPLCQATLRIDDTGVSLDCTADFKIFNAHMSGFFEYGFQTWGVEGHAALEIAGFTISGAHIELGNKGVRASFTLLGMTASVGPVTLGEIGSAIKKAALAIINPYELAKRAAKAIAKGAKKVAGAVADGAKAVASGAVHAAKKVGGYLSSAASAVFGGGISMADMVKKLEEKAAAAKAKKEGDRKAALARAKVYCEAMAGRIVKEHGMQKALAFAEKMKGPMRLSRCDITAEVGGVLKKIENALAAMKNATAQIDKALLPLRALEEAKKRGLVAFYKCAVQTKSAECTGLWPHLDAKMRALAEEYAAKPAPKKREWKRGHRKHTKSSAAQKAGNARAQSAAQQRAAPATGAPKGRLIAPPLPAKGTLLKGLGFRQKPDLKSAFVFDEDKYIEKGSRVRVTDIVGEPGTPGAFCQVEHSGKPGYIRCDGPYFK